MDLTRFGARIECSLRSPCVRLRSGFLTLYVVALTVLETYFFSNNLKRCVARAVTNTVINAKNHSAKRHINT
jgi:hypothetical protein